MPLAIFAAFALAFRRLVSHAQPEPVAMTTLAHAAVSSLVIGGTYRGKVGDRKFWVMSIQGERLWYRIIRGLPDEVGKEYESTRDEFADRVILPAAVREGAD